MIVTFLLLNPETVQYFGVFTSIITVIITVNDVYDPHVATTL